MKVIIKHLLYSSLFMFNITVIAEFGSCIHVYNKFKAVLITGEQWIKETLGHLQHNGLLANVDRYK